MSVYLLMEARVKDRKRYSSYLECFSVITAKYEGKWLAYDSAVTPLTIGITPELRQPQRICLIEFPSMVQLRRCIACPEHQELLSSSSECAETRAIVIEVHSF